jgi:electron transfer flavoprotein alpha subunit
MSEQWRDVWVYLQHEDAKLTRESLELLAAGRKVADKLGQRLVGIIVGYKVMDVARDAIVHGADGVLYIDSKDFEVYFNLLYVDAIYSMVAEKKPYAFLFTANELGKDLAARIAYRAKTGLATDNIQLEVEDYFNPALKETFKNLLIQIRPDFGTRVAKIYTPRHRPQMATVRPGNFSPLRPDPSRQGKLEEYSFVPQGRYPARVKEVKQLPRPNVNLSEADAVISLGLGILRDGSGKPRDPREAYRYASELRDILRSRYGLKAEIGASRALIYAELKELQGLISKDNQVGQTGVTVSPKVYFAIGISGALQHRVGMQKSKKIVAINTDPNAPIFQIAHYPIVGDLYDDLPKLITLLGGSSVA